MFSLYLDEDAHDEDLVSALRRAGVDCLTVNDVGMRTQSDESHLAFATEAGRVLYSNNTRDYRRLDSEWRRAGRHHAGIIVLTQQRTPIGSQLRGLIAITEDSARRKCGIKSSF